MKFIIKHEIRGRLRLHIVQSRMSYREADILQYALSEYPFITKVTVQSRTQDVVICYGVSGIKCFPCCGIFGMRVQKFRNPFWRIRVGN